MLGVTKPALAESPFEECISRTDTRAVVTIPIEAEPSIDEASLPVGAEIAIFTEDDICAGHAVWQGESTALVVWGNDSQTEETDGFLPGEPLQFRIWDPEEEAVYEGEEVAVSFSSERPYFTAEQSFREGGIYVLNELKAGSGLRPTDIESIYPNPVQSHANVRVHVRDADEMRIEVYDVLGRRITTLLDQELAEGEHTIRWDMADGRGALISSGLYFVRLQHGSDVVTHPVTVVR